MNHPRPEAGGNDPRDRGHGHDGVDRDHDGHGRDRGYEDALARDHANGHALAKNQVQIYDSHYCSSCRPRQRIAKLLRAENC